MAISWEVCNLLNYYSVSVYVWGYVDRKRMYTHELTDPHRRNKQNGRLGLSQIPKTPMRDVSFPTQLRVANACIVSLAAAGTSVILSLILRLWADLACVLNRSFMAIDTAGHVYVWGKNVEPFIPSFGT